MYISNNGIEAMTARKHRPTPGFYETNTLEGKAAQKKCVITRQFACQCDRRTNSTFPIDSVPLNPIAAKDHTKTNVF